MAHLISKHDPYHIHKLLGLIALLDYIYRFIMIFVHSTAFPRFESSMFSTISVAVHGALSWSSLLLPLPTKRNFHAPMIWPEFRLHSITFGTRHVIATILALNGWWPDESNILLRTLSRAVLVLGTNLLASRITEKYGDREKRTTNAMPYPSHVTCEQQLKIKHAYSRAQFAATKACLLSDATISFAPMLGIQIAPLLMTLVRKGKINSLTYHRVYAFSLFIGYMAVLKRTIGDPQLATIAFTVLSFPAETLRKHISSPVLLGIIQVVFSMAISPTLLLPFLKSLVTESNVHLVTRAIWMGTVATALRQMEVYRPLFIVSRASTKTNSTTTGSLCSSLAHFSEHVVPIALVVYYFIAEYTGDTDSHNSKASTV